MMIRKIFFLSISIMLYYVPVEAQDNIEIGSNEPTGYIKANQPYRIGTQDGVLYVFFGREPHVLVRFPEEDSRTSFTVPNTVVRIARGAFSGCRNLEELILPSSIYLIGDNAFDNSGIVSFKMEEDTRVNAPSNDVSSTLGYYDLSGKKLDQPTAGINVVIENGTSKKTLIK